MISYARVTKDTEGSCEREAKIRWREMENVYAIDQLKVEQR
jgi:hypothetical protein